MTRRLALLAALACALAAHAEPWRQLADTPVGQMHIDEGSIHTRDGKTAFTYRIDIPTPQKNTAGKVYQTAVMDAVISCGQKTIALTRIATYAQRGGKGGLVESQPVAGEPQPIAADASSELLRQAVCERSSAPAKKAPAKKGPG